jgi:hypothetical protein
MTTEEWKSYEDLATYLLGQWADQFGLKRVERGGKIIGLRSGTEYSLDAKGFIKDGEGFLIIECRRYLRSKQKQEQMGGLAYRIIDTGAKGGFLVSPLGLQNGAKLIATAENIQEVLLGPESTTTDHVISFLNKILISKSIPIASGVRLVISFMSLDDEKK